VRLCLKERYKECMREKRVREHGEKLEDNMEKELESVERMRRYCGKRVREHGENENIIWRKD
jgi:hypothetical protein